MVYRGPDEWPQQKQQRAARTFGKDRISIQEIYGRLYFK